ncbi:MAG: hypothetical protein JW717_04040 [Marinilabiliaceae bacterium]|nr:hypothetical protein [Marinilabiliaceae bacterium]
MNSVAIVKEVIISNGIVLINNQEFFSDDSVEEDSFLKLLYKKLELKYSKFYKMDVLSKLGFLSVELLLNGERIKTESGETAIVFANRSSSLYTDIEYQKSIDEIPSPSVFVYTLPNIVIGEICIRHKFYGENMFFVQEKYDKKFLINYVSTLFRTTETKNAIVGWLEVDVDGNYNAEIMLCKKI